MSKTIAHFLAEPKSEVAKFIHSAEKLCGYPGEDIKLLSQTRQLSLRKIAQLGLDPDDTTARELYFALRSKAAKDGQLFDRLIGLDHSVDSSKRLQTLFNHSHEIELVFALKTTSVKGLLQAVPPKKLMKQLKYRTVDSMLKREDLSSIMAAAQNLESALWHRRFSQACKRLTSSDFQLQPIKLVCLNLRYTEFIHAQLQPIYLIGAIVFKDSLTHGQSGLESTLKLLRAAEKIQKWSFLATQKQFSSGFSKFVSQYSEGLPEAAKLLGNQQIDLSLMHGKLDSPIKKLAGISLPLAWWQENDHLGLIGKSKPVSFSLHDLLRDHLSNVSFQDRQTKNFRTNFWHELIGRYLKYPSFKGEIMNQLNPEPVMVENNELVDDFSLEQLLETV